MKAKRKLGIFGFLMIFVAIFSTMFFSLPKTTKQVYAISATEQSSLNSILTFQVIEHSGDVFETKKYDEVFNNLTMFSLHYSLLTNSKTIDELDISDAEREIVVEKLTKIETLGNELEKYLKQVYNEIKQFSAISAIFVYDDVTEIDEQKKNDLTAVKNSNINFWENEIYLTYVNAAPGETEEDPSGETLAKTAKENIDKCLNKLIALEIYPQKIAYFEAEVNKLPEIRDAKRENYETLTKLKIELDEFYATYAVHLDAENKQKVEGFKWYVDKSLEQISNIDNNWAIFWIVLIIGGIAGVVIILKYFVFPKLNRKRGQRKK